MRGGWRWAGLGLLLVAGGVGLLGWQARQPAQLAAAMPASAPQAVASSATPSSAQASRPEAATVAGLAAAASAASQPKSEVSKEFIDVCGVGPIRRTELERRDDPSMPAWAQALERQGEQGLSDVLKRLDAGSLKQRVAAASLRGDVQAAAQLAASTDDVSTYRLALRACRKDAAYRSTYAYTKQERAKLAASAASGFEMPELAVPGPVPNACAALSLERLELLDPGDAWPWLVRLNDAVPRADEAGITQALYQIAQRRSVSANTRALGATVADIIGTEPTPGEAWAMVMAVGTDMASTMEGSLLSVGRHCRPEALRDANRRQLCEQVARRMPGMATDAMDSRVLHSLEERLGLPHSPQALSREEVERATKALGEESTRWMTEPTCSNASIMGRELVKLAREGELAVMRAYLKAQPASAPR